MWLCWYIRNVYTAFYIRGLRWITSTVAGATRLCGFSWVWSVLFKITPAVTVDLSALRSNHTVWQTIGWCFVTVRLVFCRLMRWHVRCRRADGDTPIPRLQEYSITVCLLGGKCGQLAQTVSFNKNTVATLLTLATGLRCLSCSFFNILVTLMCCCLG